MALKNCPVCQYECGIVNRCPQCQFDIDEYIYASSKDQIEIVEDYRSKLTIKSVKVESELSYKAEINESIEHSTHEMKNNGRESKQILEYDKKPTIQSESKKDTKANHLGISENLIKTVESKSYSSDIKNSDLGDIHQLPDIVNSVLCEHISVRYRLVKSALKYAIVIASSVIITLFVLKYYKSQFIKEDRNGVANKSLEVAKMPPDIVQSTHSPTQTTSAPSESATPSVQAVLSCKDVVYGSENYASNMTKLAVKANLPSNYYNRYHEHVVENLCNDSIKYIDELVDYGHITIDEVMTIAKELGKTYSEPKRSQDGKKYSYILNKILEMGLCDSCANNIVNYYINKPSSSCAKLAKQALEGDSESTKKLVSYPGYCMSKHQ